jgi:hypothetical protein
VYNSETLSEHVLGLICTPNYVLYPKKKKTLLRRTDKNISFALTDSRTSVRGG